MRYLSAVFLNSLVILDAVIQLKWYCFVLVLVTLGLWIFVGWLILMWDCFRLWFVIKLVLKHNIYKLEANEHGPKLNVLILLFTKPRTLSYFMWGLFYRKFGFANLFESNPNSLSWLKSFPSQNFSTSSVVSLLWRSYFTWSINVHQDIAVWRYWHATDYPRKLSDLKTSPVQLFCRIKDVIKVW